MIRITIELQSVRTGRTTILGRMFIWNKGQEDAKKTKNKKGRYNYGVAVCRKGCYANSFANIPTKTTRIGKVLNYPSEALNVWRLITRALLSAFPEEKV